MELNKISHDHLREILRRPPVFIIDAVERLTPSQHAMKEKFPEGPMSPAFHAHQLTSHDLVQLLFRLEDAIEAFGVDVNKACDKMGEVLTK